MPACFSAHYVPLCLLVSAVCHSRRRWPCETGSVGQPPAGPRAGALAPDGWQGETMVALRLQHLSRSPHARGLAETGMRWQRLRIAQKKMQKITAMESKDPETLNR